VLVQRGESCDSSKLMFHSPAPRGRAVRGGHRVRPHVSYPRGMDQFALVPPRRMGEVVIAHPLQATVRIEALSRYVPKDARPC